MGMGWWSGRPMTNYFGIIIPFLWMKIKHMWSNQPASERVVSLFGIKYGWKTTYFAGEISCKYGFQYVYIDIITNMYIYIYIHVYIVYVYIYIYICIFKCGSSNSRMSASALFLGFHLFFLSGERNRNSLPPTPQAIQLDYGSLHEHVGTPYGWFL